jgi:adenylate cyclase
MPPSADDVRRQLERLLASPLFANAGRMSRFLTFVVEQALAGESERLKEYVIGVEVFDRDADYDPRVDAIVRVEAARLRAKLAEYYAGEGRGDAVVVSLPKGGYAPAIRLDEGLPANGAATIDGPASAPASKRIALPVAGVHRRRVAGWLGAAVVAGVATLAVVIGKPAVAPLPELRVAVLPFAVDSRDASAAALATRLTEGVTAELVRTGHYAVVASSAARAAATAAARPRDIAAALDADVLIEARVSTDGERVHVEARAASGSSEQKFWVDSFAGTIADSAALEREIAAAIATLSMGVAR